MAAGQGPRRVLLRAGPEREPLPPGFPPRAWSGKLAPELLGFSRKGARHDEQNVPGFGPFLPAGIVASGLRTDRVGKMTEIDQFESVFKAAVRSVFTYEAIAFNRVLVISDLEDSAAG